MFPIMLVVGRTDHIPFPWVIVGFPGFTLKRCLTACHIPFVCKHIMTYDSFVNAVVMKGWIESSAMSPLLSRHSLTGVTLLFGCLQAQFPRDWT